MMNYVAGPALMFLVFAMSLVFYAVVIACIFMIGLFVA